MQNAIDAGNARILKHLRGRKLGHQQRHGAVRSASIPSASIVSVAASRRLDARASFSNYETTSVDLARHGVSIVSTDTAAHHSTRKRHQHGDAARGRRRGAVVVRRSQPRCQPEPNRCCLPTLTRADRGRASSRSGGRLNAYGAALAASGDLPPTAA